MTVSNKNKTPSLSSAVISTKRIDTFININSSLTFKMPEAG